MHVAFQIGINANRKEKKVRGTSVATSSEAATNQGFSSWPLGYLTRIYPAGYFIRQEFHGNQYPENTWNIFGYKNLSYFAWTGIFIERWCSVKFPSISSSHHILQIVNFHSFLLLSKKNHYHTYSSWKQKLADSPTGAEISWLPEAEDFPQIVMTVVSRKFIVFVCSLRLFTLLSNVGDWL